jgi:protein-tyrosine-phosphatase
MQAVAADALGAAKAEAAQAREAAAAAAAAAAASAPDEQTLALLREAGEELKALRSDMLQAEEQLAAAKVCSIVVQARPRMTPHDTTPS